MTKKIKIHIDGMHCGSCEVLIEQAWKKLPGVHSVDVDSSNGYAILETNNIPTLEQLNAPITEHGYNAHYISEISDSENKNDTTKKSNLDTSNEILPKDRKKILGIIIIALALLWVAKKFGVIPNVSLTYSMGYGFVFVIGLVAAVSTCIATTGGLLVAVATKYSEAHPELRGYQRFRPHIYFNIGRIISYTVLGGVAGAIGSTLTLSPTTTGILTIIASTVMVLLGFQMLKIFPRLRRFQPKMPKSWAHKIHDMSGSNKKSTPFILGALTFFLPCGFTQALQIYSLSSGSAMTGALTMFFFALGTLPALLSLGALSSFTKGKFHLYFTQIAGALILIIGLTTIRNGVALIDFSNANASNTPVTQTNNVKTNPGEVQKIAMNINGTDYEPYQFTVKKGTPVEWKIDASKASGCMKAGIVAQGLGIRESLSSTKKIVRFTPTKTGKFKFSCPMGMGTFGATITVIE